MENDIQQEILNELRESRLRTEKINNLAKKLVYWLGVPLFIAILSLAALISSDIIEKYKKKSDVKYPQIINSYRNMGDFDKAIEKSKKFVEKAPDNYYAWALLGWSYFDKGDLTEARKSIEKSLQLYPDYESGQKVLKSINLRLAQKNKK